MSKYPEVNMDTAESWRYFTLTLAKRNIVHTVCTLAVMVGAVHHTGFVLQRTVTERLHFTRI